MSWRVLGAALLVLVLGAGAGYAYAATRSEDQPSSFESASPVPASSPSIPVETFNPDPDDPPLETGIDVAPRRFVVRDDDGKPVSDPVTLPVPVGWTVTQASPTRWQAVVDGNDSNSYGMRIDVIADEGLNVDSAIQSRLSEFDSAEAQGNLSDVDFTLAPAGFEGSYVFDGFLRLDFEQFFTGSDPDLAYATVAVYGREKDRAGLEDLLATVAIARRIG